MTNTLCSTRIQLTRLALGACLALFTACAGESPTEAAGPNPTPKPTPTPVANGVLTITVTGLEAGQSADIAVSGPAGFSRAVSTAGSITGLAAGRYTVAARAVSANGRTWAPASVTQDVDIGSDGIPVSATVAYRIESGVVIVTVNGLPGGAPADITLTPPAGATVSVAATRQLDDVVPGRWRLAASPVASGGHTYRPSPASYDLTLSPHDTLRLPVNYALATGSIAVAVTGLPSGTNGSVSVTGPGSFSQVVTGTITLTDLVPGEYTVSASAVTVGGIVYAPAPPQRTVTVTASLVAEAAAVRYEPQLGRLDISAPGLPASITPTFTLTGSSGARELNGAGTIDSLVPGTYTLDAATLVNGATTYTPTPASQSVVITSASTTSASFAYAASATPGSLGIAISGLGAGATGDVLVTGPNDFTRVLTTTTTITGIAPGAYTITARNVVTALVTYGVTPASREVNVTAGGNATASIVYAALPAAPVAGSLAVTVAGLPGGANGSVSVTGPGGFAQSVTATTVLTNLVPGSYTLNASVVTSGGNSYTPTPSSSTVSVTAGATASATFTYATGGGSGTNLSIDNVIVMQAAQNWSGTAEIVTGRNALVRVFVKASATNTLQPDVRVRVYDGATLIQTATIPAASGGVPTAVTEGSLNASWNVQIPAANVRASLRVLADVDPTNAIGESNRTDNSWPSDGTPATIATATVPALNVTFVPIVLNGVTGNVTTGNKDQFLAMTRLVMPVQTVTSTVRAPFTSNAPPLQSGNGNNAWSTVLSEINALRSADGAASTTHYYGVVKAGYSSGVAGIAYVPGRAAVGWDALPSGDRVAAHELGHNFSRPHTPCGVSGDGAYPYSGGVTGVYGWNATTNVLVSPTFTDVMGYCSNQWISDWTWSKVLEYRAASGYQASTASVGDGLLIWGRVTDGRMLLEPAFRVRARATAPAARPTHRVLLSDASGSTLAELPIEAQLVDHVADHDERQFAVVVPWSDQLERAVARMAVVDGRSPFPAAVRASSVAAAAKTAAMVMRDPNVTLTAAGTDRTRVEWDAARYPMAMVRDAATGEILSFLRSTGDGFADRGQAVDIVFSDGVRSATRSLQRPR